MLGGLQERLIGTRAHTRQETVRERLSVLALFVVFLVVRIPTLTRMSVNWDAVNLTLGVHAFDLVHHQPHPPGYIGFIALGRVLATVTGDPHRALTLISLAAGAILPAAFYLLARRMGIPRRAALLVAGLLGSSPVVWYYSVVALTYLAAAAVTVVLVWACYTARTRRSARHLSAAAGVLVVLGAIRQTDLLLMLPVFAWALGPFAARVRWRAVGILAVGTAVWTVPLLWAAGGPVAYLRLAADLAQLAGGATWVGSLNPIGLLQNVSYVVGGLLVGLNVALIALPLALRKRVRPWSRLSSDDRALLVRWLAPAAVVYLFVHTGQLGYVLLLLPAGFLLAGVVLDQVWSEVEVRWADVRPRDRVGWGLRAATAVTLLVGFNAAGFFVLPDAAVALLGPGADGNAAEVAGSFTENSSQVHARTRQYNLPANDAHWRNLIRFVGALDPATTVVLSQPANDGSFRHLTYYLPGFRVHGLGRDRDGRFGHLFTGHDRRIDYRVEALERARGALTLDEGVETLIVPDGGIQERLDPRLDRHLIRLSTGAVVVLVHVDHGTRLVFEPVGDGETRITVGPSQTVVRGVRR